MTFTKPKCRAATGLTETVLSLPSSSPYPPALPSRYLPSTQPWIWLLSLFPAQPGSSAQLTLVSQSCLSVATSITKSTWSSNSAPTPNFQLGCPELGQQVPKTATSTNLSGLQTPPVTPGSQTYISFVSHTWQSWRTLYWNRFTLFSHWA